MPLSPPYLFSAVSIVAGDISTPSIATGSPFLNSISMYVGSSGASSGDTERVNISSEYSSQGSSSALPS